jgi:hypothetical protein
MKDEINLPGFTADTVLNGCWRRDQVIPAIQKGGGNPHAECMIDCRDEGHSEKECRERICRDPGGPYPTPPESTDQRVNHALCVGGCWAWYAACSANPFGFLCGTIRDQCLKDC